MSSLPGSFFPCVAYAHGYKLINSGVYVYIDKMKAKSTLFSLCRSQLAHYSKVGLKQRVSKADVTGL